MAVRELATGPIQAFVQRPESEVGGEQPWQLVGPIPVPKSARQQAAAGSGREGERVDFSRFGTAASGAGGTGAAPVFAGWLDHTVSSQPGVGGDLPPARNQHGSSHWPVMRVVVAHDVVNALAAPPCYGPQAVSEQALAKQIMSRLPAGCGVLGDSNFGAFRWLTMPLNTTTPVCSTHRGASKEIAWRLCSGIENGPNDSMGSQQRGPAQQPGNSRRGFGGRTFAGIQGSRFERPMAEIVFLHHPDCSGRPDLESLWLPLEH